MVEQATRWLGKRRFDQALLLLLADYLAVAVVVSLPWSTSVTSILITLWLIALLPVVDGATIRREVTTFAGGLPVLLWVLACAGMLWADADMMERLHGLSSFHRLLVIPLLMVQFRRSGYGQWAITGFLISCCVLLAASWIQALTWGMLPWNLGPTRGVPVKDYITLSGLFEICIFGLAYAAVDAWRFGRREMALKQAALALIFLINIAYISTGRTALAVMPVLLILFALRLFHWRGRFVILVIGAVLTALIWMSSPYLRARVTGIENEIQLYETENADTSSGARLEFWKKSIGFVATAPLIGHGTGSINEEFRRAVIGTNGVSAAASHNPHQQILAVAIQLGLVGAFVLIAMWAAHVALFHGAGLTAWLGFIVVVQNIVSSLFNSHLFDFTQGWFYVFGVGIIGGMLFHERSVNPSAVSPDRGDMQA